MRWTPRALLTAAIVLLVCLCATIAQALPSATPDNTGMVDFPGAGGSSNAVAVRTIQQFGSNVWVGGLFSEIDDGNGNRVRDADNLAAFNAGSGSLASGVHMPAVTKAGGGAEVYDASVGPDGNLYFAGVFDAVDGQPRKNVAAVDAQTGELTSFAPNVAAAMSVLATASAIYVGTGKLLSFQRNGAPTPGYSAPSAIIDASLRAHVTVPNFRDIAILGNTLVAACQCDSLTDANGARTVKAAVEVNGTTGNWVNWRPANLPDASGAFGINLVLHPNPSTGNQAVYLAAGGSDFTAGYDFDSGKQLFKTDTSGSSQAIEWYQGSVIVGGHFDWTQAPGASSCGDNGHPNLDCYHSPHLVAMNPSTGAVLLVGGKPWNPGICCKYNGVWALLTGNDGSTLHVGGEFTKAGGTWSGSGTNWTLGGGAGTQKFYARFGGPPSNTQTLTVAKSSVAAGAGTVSSTPSGISCNAACTADSSSFPTGTSVTLTAAAASGSTFTGWSSSDAGFSCPGTGTCTVAMNIARTVTATFTGVSFLLTVTRTGAGTGIVNSSPAGISCGGACSASFAQNTPVMLTATPAAGSIFAGWTGSGCSGTGSCVVTMSTARSVSADFAVDTNRVLTVLKSGATGTVTSSPAGINCGGACSVSFAQSTAVTLTAAPGSGNAFTGWSSPDAGFSCPGTGTCQITMNVARTVTATFAGITFPLTVTKSGTGAGTVTSTPAGINCGAACSSSFAQGTTVTLHAAAGSDSVFIGWSGEGCAGTTTCQVSMSAARDVTATFASSLVALTVTKPGGGAGTVSSSPAGINCTGGCTNASASFAPSTPVSLTATAAGGFVFNGWSGGGCAGPNPVCVLTMDGPRSVNADFVTAKKVVLTIAGAGSGLVTSDPSALSCSADCSQAFVQGSTVTLTATADQNSIFTGWSGTGGCTGTGTCELAMSQQRQVTATFQPAFTLSVTPGGTGSGAVTSSPAGIDCGTTCSTRFRSGTVVTLSAAADASSSTFTGWIGEGCSGTGTCQVTMSQARNVTASFTHLQRQLNVTVAGQGSVTDAPGPINCGPGGSGTCSASYEHGTDVLLTPTPAQNWSFSGWSGDCTGTDVCVVSMTALRTVTATFERITRTVSVTMAGSGSGTVNSTPAGISCPGDCSEGYNQGDAVQLTAQADPGSMFTGWGGSCSGISTCPLTIDGEKNVTATFELIQHLTAATAGGPGSVTSDVGGIACGATCVSTDLAHGSHVILTAHPGAGYAVAGWGDPACPMATPACDVTIDADRTVTVTFAVAVNLTITSSGAGAGAVTSVPAALSCPGTCAASIAQNGSVTLHAVPDGSSVFAGWSGGGCSGTGDCVVPMSADTAVDARFDVAQRLLTVAMAGTGTGRVTSSPGTIDCPGTCGQTFGNGTAVQLTATPAANVTFAGWSGDCTGTGACSVSMSAARNVTATFSTVTHSLVVSKDGTGTGVVSSAPAGIGCGGTCSAVYGHGTGIQLTATPDATMVFAGWSGGGCSGTSTCNVMLNTDTAVIATFNAPSSGTTTLSESDPAVAFNGWLGVVDPTANGGAYRESKVKGDKVVWTSPAATSITWVARSGPDQGKASVVIDGVNKGTVDLYAASVGSLNEGFSGLTNKAHKVVITVLHAKRPSSTGFGVRLDALRAAGTTAQEWSPSILFDTWASVTQAKAAGGIYRVASGSTATLTVRFTGTSIDWLSARGKAFGRAAVSIDGVSKGTVDLYQSTAAWQAKLSYGGLTAGPHALTIQVLGTKTAASKGTKVVVDGFVVHA